MVAQKNFEIIKGLQERIEASIVETLEDESVPVIERLAAVIGAQSGKPDGYAWAGTDYEYALRFDERIKHLAKFGGTATESIVALVPRVASKYHHGAGMLICRLAVEDPWTIEVTRERRQVKNIDLVANLEPGAILVTHTHDTSDCNCHTHISTYPSTSPFRETQATLSLPTKPDGVMHFTERLSGIARISGTGFDGVQRVAKHIGDTSGDPRVEPTLLAGAMRALATKTP